MNQGIWKRDILGNWYVSVGRIPREKCFRGHEFTKANTIVGLDQRRRCRKCVNARHSAWVKAHPEYANWHHRRQYVRRKACLRIRLPKQIHDPDIPLHRFCVRLDDERHRLLSSELSPLEALMIKEEEATSVMT